MQGRARIAVVVAAASVLGATAGAGVPALAGDDPPSAAAIACADPTRTVPTVTVEEQEIDCETLTTTTGQQGSTGDGPTTSDVPAQTTPASPPPPPPADPPAQAAATAAAADPATQAPEPAAAPAPEPAASTELPAIDESTKSGVTKHMPAANAGRAADPRAKKTLPTDPRSHEADAEDTAPPSKSRSQARSASKSSSHATKSEDRAHARAHASQEAITYASLPSSWTSLTPLTLPSFGVDGFPIPPFLLPVYQAAAAQYAVPWQILASINEIETDFGRNAGVSSAGALGFMQFIYSSWERWGTDSDGDHRRDPRNPVDAIFAAARYLHDAGAGTDLPKAIFAYNHADWYVNRVVSRAREFASLDDTLVAALTARALRENVRLYRARGNPFAGYGAVDPNPGQALLLTKHQLTRTVLHSDDIEVYAGGRQDIAKGRVDRRVLATLVFLARSGMKPSVSSLMTGHSLLTTSGNLSAHSYGYAVDISAINGVPIVGHQGADSITAKALDKLVQLQGYLQPNQIISLMTVDGHDNTLSMGDHDDHIHVGFPRVPKVPDAGRPSDIRKLAAVLRANPRG